MGAGIVIPWMILLAYEGYNQGYKKQQLPAPYHFLYATFAMGLAGIVSQANERVGVLLAWGFLLGALVSQYQKQATAPTQPSNPANPPHRAGTQVG